MLSGVGKIKRGFTAEHQNVFAVLKFNSGCYHTQRLSSDCLTDSSLEWHQSLHIDLSAKDIAGRDPPPDTRDSQQIQRDKLLRGRDTYDKNMQYSLPPHPTTAANTVDILLYKGVVGNEELVAQGTVPLKRLLPKDTNQALSLTGTPRTVDVKLDKDIGLCISVVSCECLTIPDWARSNGIALGLGKYMFNTPVGNLGQLDKNIAVPEYVLFVKCRLVDWKGSARKHGDDYISTEKTSASVSVSASPKWPPESDFIYRATCGKFHRASYARLELYVGNSVLVGHEALIGTAFVPLEFFQGKEETYTLSLIHI